MNNNQKPPKFLLAFFRWFCHPDYAEDIEGDLLERYEHNVQNKSITRAKWMFFWEVIRLLRPSMIRQFGKEISPYFFYMLNHHIKIAYRHTLKNKFFSIVNVLGLATGIAMCLLIAIYVNNEVNYETNYPKHERIFRLASKKWAKQPPMIAKQLSEKIPEIEAVGSLFSFDATPFEYKEREILIERPFLGNQSVLEIFDIEFIEGSQNALEKPSTVVLTETTASKLFKPGENRIGEVVLFDSGWPLTVKGIIADFPQNTHLQLDCIISSNRSSIMNSTDRFWAAVSIYALLDSPNSALNVREKLKDFHVAFFEGLLTKEEVLKDVEPLQLNPITEIHLHSHREKEIGVNSDIKLVYIFSILGVFILVVVIINFANLSVAQALSRIKEIALRKVMGGVRNQLIVQFLSESFFLVIASTLLALGIVTLALPYYNEMAAIPISVARISFLLKFCQCS